MSTRFEPLIASLKCQDVDELVEAARHWNEDYLQLGTGSLRTMVDIFQFGSIQFGCQQWNLYLQVSERTLRYSFQDCLGISPMTYLKVQRLHGVRRELKSGHFSGMKINQIATRWGFWHMGQFSQDYQKLFGEFPSQTLRIHN